MYLHTRYIISLIPHFSGNLALWDQHLALCWIQRNIVHFGGKQKIIIGLRPRIYSDKDTRGHKYPGDPGKVTVFSNSAGSFCTFCLYVSPQCEVSANSKLLNYSIQVVVKSFFQVSSSNMFCSGPFSPSDLSIWAAHLKQLTHAG